MHLVIEFQEEYKRLDALCKDMLSGEYGITQYINEMEKYSALGKYKIEDWEHDYKDLKHVRWVRNQLAHEVGALQSGICKQSDLLFVKGFHHRILKGKDPLALLRKDIDKPQKKKEGFFTKLKRFFTGR
jgi:hypothetical protein